MYRLILIAVLTASSAHAASVERGRTLYMKVGCHQCHGTVGQGGTAGPKLAPGPQPWEAFDQFVRHSPNAMPPYREIVLPDADLRDIYAYLQSVPAAASIDKIPLLKPRP